MTKTFTNKQNAVRAAKRECGDFFAVEQQADGRWGFRNTAENAAAALGLTLAQAKGEDFPDALDRAEHERREGEVLEIEPTEEFRQLARESLSGEIDPMTGLTWEEGARRAKALREALESGDQELAQAVVTDNAKALEAAKERTSIEQIALDVLSIETLEPRNSDSLDFHTLAVWQIENALAAAFNAGVAAGAGTKAQRPARGPRAPAEGPSKKDLAAALLTRTEGCTGREILDATGWPTVSVPAIAKAAGLTLRQEKVPGSPTRYFGTKN